MKYSSGETLTGRLKEPLVMAVRNYSQERPVSREIFQVYKSLYSYDRTPLDPVTESVDESDESWKKEKITFQAAYGKERVIAYLFLPKRVAPPYQTIVYFPGGDAITESGNDLYTQPPGSFVIKSGRAVFYPIYKGTYERKDGLKSYYPEATSLYRDHVIYWAKDLGRSIDYLETRPDINRDKIGCPR